MRAISASEHTAEAAELSSFAGGDLPPPRASAPPASLLYTWRAIHHHDGAEECSSRATSRCTATAPSSSWIQKRRPTRIGRRVALSHKGYRSGSAAGEAAAAAAARRRAAAAAAAPRHMHPLHYWPAGTQKFLNPRTGRAPSGFSHNTPQDISGVFCENRLSSRSKLPNLERAPFWVYR
jgi:hypothetical protein